MKTILIVIFAAWLSQELSGTPLPKVTSIQYQASSKEEPININTTAELCAYVGEPCYIIVRAKNASGEACKDAAVYLGFPDLVNSSDSSSVEIVDKGGLDAGNIYRPKIDTIYRYGAPITANYTLCRVGTNDNTTWLENSVKKVKVKFTPPKSLWSGQSSYVYIEVKCTMANNSGEYGFDPRGWINSNPFLKNYVTTNAKDQQDEWVYRFSLKLVAKDDKYEPNDNGPNSSFNFSATSNKSNAKNLILANKDQYRITNIPPGARIVVKSICDFDIRASSGYPEYPSDDYFIGEWLNSELTSQSVEIIFPYESPGIESYWFDYWYKEHAHPAFGNPPWSKKPEPLGSGPNNYTISMEVAAATYEPDGRSVQYLIEPVPNPESAAQSIGWVNTRSYTFQNLSPNTKYSFRYYIRDATLNKNPNPSTTEATYTHIQSPELKVEASTANSITLKATPLDSSYTNFVNLGTESARIVFSRTAGDSISIKDSPPVATFDGLSPNTLYTFTALSYNSNNISNPRQATISAYTKCATPSKPEIVRLTSHSVMLRPNQSDTSGASNWQIELRPQGSTSQSQYAFSTLIYDRTNGFEFTVTHGLIYEARVWAENAKGDSTGPSAALTFTVPEPARYRLRAIIQDNQSEIYPEVEISGESHFCPYIFDVSIGDTLPALTWENPYDANGYRNMPISNSGYPSGSIASANNAGIYTQLYQRTGVRFQLSSNPHGSSGVDGDHYVTYYYLGRWTAQQNSGGYTFSHWRLDGTTEMRYNLSLERSCSYSSVPEYWIAEYTDQTAPNAPSLNIEPANWSKAVNYSIEWSKPLEEPTDIAEVWYKVNNAPASPNDGLSNNLFPHASSGSISVSIAEQGLIPVYVWLKDAAGNVNYTNYGVIKAKRDCQPPTNVSFTINDESEVIDSHIVNLTGIHGEDSLSGVAWLKVRTNEGNWSDPQPYPGNGGTVTSWDLLNGGSELRLGQNQVFLILGDAAGNWMEDSEAASFNVDYQPTALEPPSLVPTVLSNVQIKLELTPAGRIDYAIIQWATDPSSLGNDDPEGEFTYEGTTKWTQAHTGLVRNTTYYYRAKTKNNSLLRESPWTSTLSARTLDNPPTGVTQYTVTPYDYQRVDLSWAWVSGPGAGVAKKHRLSWRKEGSNTWSSVDLDPGSSLSYSVTGLLADTLYNFQVWVISDDYQIPGPIVPARTFKLPDLTVAPQSTLFTAVQGPGHRPKMMVIVANSGDGRLSWTSRSMRGLASMYPAAGVLSAGQSTMVEVYLTTDSLPEGKAVFEVAFSSTIAGKVVSKSVIYEGHITNAQPSATHLRIQPGNPITGTPLTATYSYSDPDGHGEGSSRIRWMVNGAPFGSGSVPKGQVYRDQQWYFIVEPHDGYKYGVAVSSPVVTIGNAPPTMAGTSRIINQEGSDSIALDSFASDIDDAQNGLSFSIANQPAPGLGATIANRTLYLNPVTQYFGTADIVQISVSDGRSYATADFHIYVDARPTLIGTPPPTYTKKRGESMRLDLWQYFQDTETTKQQLHFTTVCSQPETRWQAKLEQNRYLALYEPGLWPSNEDGQQTLSLAITAQDNRGQIVTWTPSLTVVPVNLPPNWTGFMVNLTMYDSDPNPLARTSGDSSSLRSILHDPDTNLSLLPNNDLFVVITTDQRMAATLENDQIRLNPNGGLYGTIKVTVTANDRETRFPPYNQTSSTSFQVTVLDDDTAAPVCSGVHAIMVDPAAAEPLVDKGTIRIEENRPFYIACTITDNQSGVYDDATGGHQGEQGAYLVWDVDGELGNGYAGLLQMERLSGDLFRSVAPVPGLEGTVNRKFVYQIFAWDNDVDRGYTGDRAAGRTDQRKDIIINQHPRVFPVEITAEQFLSVPLGFSLADANGDLLDLSVEYFDPRDQEWHSADLQDAHLQLQGYGGRTVTWRSAYQDADGSWEGNLPGLDLGDPLSPWPNPVQVRFRAFDGQLRSEFAAISFHLDNNLLPEIVLQNTYASYVAQGWDSLPSFDFLIHDVEKDTVNLRMEHRWSPAGPWYSSTLSYEGGAWSAVTIPGIAPASYDLQPLSIRWDAVADAVRDGVVPHQPGVIQGVSLRLTSNDRDSTEAGGRSLSKSFAVDLFPAPQIVLIGEPEVEDGANTIRHLEQTYRIDPGYVRHDTGGQVWYSGVAGRNLGSGPSNPVGPVLTMRYAYRLAETEAEQSIDPLSGVLTGLNLPSKTPAQYRNQDIDISWLFSLDESTLPRRRLAGAAFLLAADSHLAGHYTTVGPLDLDNNFHPEVTSLAVAPDGNRILPGGAFRGDVAFEVGLQDRESDLMSLRFAYSLDGDAWFEATITEPARQTGLGNGRHRFIWRAPLDLPLAAYDEVWFQVAADDAAPGAFTPLPEVIALDNRNLSPVAQLIDMRHVENAPGRPMVIHLGITDENDDPVRIVHFAYTLDDGMQWTSLPLAALVSNVPTRSGELTVFWDPTDLYSTLAPGTPIRFRWGLDDGTDFASESQAIGHQTVHAMSWDGANFWTFDFAANRAYRHDLNAAGWPLLDPTGVQLSLDYPETLDASGKDGSPWVLWPQESPARTLLFNLRWMGSSFASPLTRLANNLVGAGFALASGNEAYATVPSTRQFARIDSATGAYTTYGNLETPHENILAWRWQDDDKDGLWTLEQGTGIIRQYHLDQLTGTWECVRWLDSGHPGLRSIDFRHGLLWSIDTAHGAIIRTDEISASRLVYSDDFTVEAVSGWEAPQVGAISVDNTNPFTHEDLTLVVPSPSPLPRSQSGAGAAASLIIRWSRNGDYISAFDGFQVIPAAETTAGDVWQAYVWADNGQRLGPGTILPAIRIADSAPHAGTLAAFPVLAHTGDNLSITGWPVDPDSGPVTVTYSWVRNGELFPWTSATLPHWATSTGDTWQASVSAEDLAGETSLFQFSWTIDNRPPVFLPLPAMAVNEADWLWFRVEAEDPEGHGMTFSIDLLPEDLPGLVMWHPAGQTFFWYPSYGSAGEYTIGFYATDPYGATSWMEVAVSVVHTPRPPYILAPADIYVQEGQTIDLLAGQSGGHLDLVPGTVPLSLLRDLGVRFSATGWKAGQWSDHLTCSTTFDDAGLHTVELTATDEAGISSDPRPLLIHVANVNRPPQITAPPSITGIVRQPLQFTISASDPDGDGMHLFGSGPLASDPAPSGTDAWTFSWVPEHQDAGDYQMLVEVVDDGDPSLSTTHVVQITIAPDTDLDSMGDGIPDVWKLHYFLALDVDLAADPDADGFTNREEYFAGSDPLDPISFPATASRTYHFSPGWNSMVIDLTAPDLTVGALTAPIAAQMRQVRWWDAHRQRWNRWDRLHPEFDAPADSGQMQVPVFSVLLIEVLEPVTLEIHGSTAHPGVALLPGWNLTGLPSFTTLALPEATADLSGSCESISDGHGHSYNLVTGQTQGQFDTATPRHPYWLWMNQSAIWMPR